MCSHSCRPAIPGNAKPSQWFVEDKWEIEDPLWRAAINASNPDFTFAGPLEIIAD